MIAPRPLDPALADLVDWLAELAADELLDAAPMTDARAEHAEERAA